MTTLRNYLFALALIASFTVTAQAAVTISATNVTDAAERRISGKLCFAPVDATSNPVGFRVNITQIVPGAVCFTISAGVLQSGNILAPSPAGIYYHVWAANRTTNAVIRDFGMTPITGSSWSLDTYDPTMIVLPVTAITVGTVTTLPPGTPPTVTLSGANPVVMNIGVPKGDTGATGPGGLDTTAVHKAGDETVAGAKTFSSSTIIAEADASTTSNATFLNQLLAMNALGVPYTMAPLVISGTGNISPDATALDIFPVGYHPWSQVVTMEDGATGLSGCSICLGIADGANGSSQVIRLTSARGLRQAPTEGHIWQTGTSGTAGVQVLNYDGAVNFASWSTPHVLSLNNAVSGYLSVLKILTPYLLNGGVARTYLGVNDATSSYNAAVWEFHYPYGTGDARNYQTLGFSGNENAFTVRGNGHVLIGSTDSADHGYGLEVNGTLKFNNLATIGLVQNSAAGVISTSTVLPSGVTATTQVASDSSTLVATTAQVHAAIAANTTLAAGTTAVTQVASDSSTLVATTAQVHSAIAANTTLATGTTAVTQAATDNSTLVATTAQVHSAILARVAVAPAAVLTQTANYGPTTILTPGVAGWYTVHCTVTVAVAAQTSSTMPPCQVVYTDADDGTTKAGTVTSSSTTNSTSTSTGGSQLIHAGAAAIKIQATGYVSVGTPAMQYKLNYSLDAN